MAMRAGLWMVGAVVAVVAPKGCASVWVGGERL